MKIKMFIIALIFTSLALPAYSAEPQNQPNQAQSSPLRAQLLKWGGLALGISAVVIMSLVVRSRKPRTSKSNPVTSYEETPPRLNNRESYSLYWSVIGGLNHAQTPEDLEKVKSDYFGQFHEKKLLWDEESDLQELFKVTERKVYLLGKIKKVKSMKEYEALHPRIFAGAVMWDREAVKQYQDDKDSFRWCKAPLKRAEELADQVLVAEWHKWCELNNHDPKKPIIMTALEVDHLDIEYEELDPNEPVAETIGRPCLKGESDRERFCAMLQPVHFK